MYFLVCVVADALAFIFFFSVVQLTSFSFEAAVVWLAWFLNLCYLLVHLAFLQADSTADFYGYVGVFVLLPDDSATSEYAKIQCFISSKNCSQGRYVHCHLVRAN